METQFANQFYQMLQHFAHLFRADVAPTYLALALAWVATPRAQRTSNLLRTLGPETNRHTATYYRFFAASQWGADLLALTLFFMICSLLGSQPVIRLAVDDTLLKHSGRCIFGASMFRDAVLSTQKKVVTRWGLNWVVLSLSLPHPLYPHEFVSIPLMARLFLTEEWCEKVETEYNSPTELAMEMMLFLYQRTPDTIAWRLVGDGAYANQHILRKEYARLHFTGTIRADACIQRPLETRPYAGRGAYPKYGLDYPKPSQLLQDRRRKVQSITFPGYGGVPITRQVVEVRGTYREVAGQRKLRFVFVKPVNGGKALYLVTTDLDSPLSEILIDFVSRWSIEVTFREAKQIMGVEKSQVWSEKAVRRMPPFGFWLMGVVKLWYLHLAPQLPKLRLFTPWYQPEGRVSFEQMLGTLRFCIFKTLLSAEKAAQDISKCFGLPEDPEEKQRWLLRLFCGC